MIVGNAMSRGNVELEYVLDERIPFASIGGLVTRSFSRAGNRWSSQARTARPRPPACWRGFTRLPRTMRPELAPSFLIGGVAENFGTSFQLRATRHLHHRGRRIRHRILRQGAEVSCTTFRMPLILTHVEFDHADIYRDLGCGKDRVQAAGKSGAATRAHRRIRCAATT